MYFAYSVNVSLLLFSVLLKNTRISLIFCEAVRGEHSSILIMSLVVMQILKMVFDMADIL